MSELLKKISPKTVMGGAIRKPEAEAPLFRVIGVVSGVETGSSNFGEWVAFKGEFKVKRADGKDYYGTKLFLPDPAETLLYTAFRGLQDKGGMIEIALDIGIKPSEVPIGYEYTAKPLLEIRSSDPLAALEAKLESGGTMALSAPVEAEAEAEGEEKLASRRTGAGNKKRR